jgi:predicted acylesterase/phospholipase RssA
MTKIHFQIIAVSLEEGLEIFDYIKTPNIAVIDALIASMNFPFIFPPYKFQFTQDDYYNKKTFIDGGLLDNFPMHLLSRDAVGLKVSFESINNIDMPIFYLGKLFEIISKRMRDLSPFKSENIIEI